MINEVAKINENAIESLKPNASNSKGYYYFPYEINIIFKPGKILFEYKKLIYYLLLQTF